MAAVLFWIALDVAFLEKISPACQFCDGSIYIRIATDPVAAIANKKIDPYYAQRLLPSSLVHLGLRLGGVAPAPETIFKGFIFLNGIALLVTAWCWGAIARVLGLSRESFYLGAMAMFVNFCVLKFNGFYPTLTDLSALAIAMVMVVAYLKRKTWAILLASALGAFAWPVLLYIGVLLVVGGGRHEPGNGVSPEPQRAESAAVWGVAMLAGLACAGAAMYIHVRLKYQHDGAPAFEQVFVLSAALLGAYVCLVVRPLLAGWREILGALAPWRRIATAIAVSALAVFAVAILIKLMASGPPRNTVKQVLLGLLATGTSKPGIFLLAHVVFFGPIVILLCFVWANACRAAIGLGPGFVAVFAASLVLAIGSESRQLMANLPFLLVPAVIALGSFVKQRGALICFAVSSLLVSKVYVRVATEGLVYSQGAEFLKLPWQAWFSSIGYWMSSEAYLIQLGAAAPLALFFWFQFFRAPASR